MGIFEDIDSPVAMENASETVKKQADFITIANDNDGIINGFKELQFI